MALILCQVWVLNLRKMNFLNLINNLKTTITIPNVTDKEATLLWDLNQNISWKEGLRECVLNQTAWVQLFAPVFTLCMTVGVSFDGPLSPFFHFLSYNPLLFLSRFVVSDSFATPWTVARQASVHGISQARILEWVVISFSRGSSQPRDQTCILALAGRYFTADPPFLLWANNCP